jgi:hypothetical protein
MSSPSWTVRNILSWASSAGARTAELMQALFTSSGGAVHPTAQMQERLPAERGAKNGIVARDQKQPARRCADVCAEALQSRKPRERVYPTRFSDGKIFYVLT